MTQQQSEVQPCVAVSAAPYTRIHLAAPGDAAPGGTTLCGAPIEGSERVRRFLVAGCPDCALTALARGVVAAADKTGAVSLGRFTSVAWQGGPVD
jgi:hypothetical protein